MSEMVERAAKAIWDANRLPTTWDWERRREPMKDETRKEARAALTAALDPEDEKLVEAVAIGMVYRVARLMLPSVAVGLNARVTPELYAAMEHTVQRLKGEYADDARADATAHMWRNTHWQEAQSAIAAAIRASASGISRASDRNGENSK